MTKFATITSYVLHPAVLMLATVVAYSSLIRPSLHAVLLDVGILLLGLFPGLLYLILQTKRGVFTSYHLVIKEQRRVTLLLLLAGLLVSFLLYRMIGVPAMMTDGMAIALIGGIIIALITWFWKISFHAAVAMGCSALFLAVSLPYMLIFFGLGILSGIVRIPVKDHTPMQVLGGWVYGFGVTVGLLWMFNYL
ncbi:hypothetical protein [Herpetosiphon geysericola]|uniref:Phosphatidic acid phosphatase type 2/haloperoxidase domain-containing protein n=1 Tax=Herpetosiphon geysericola TaxID=70996 RepID=A0A0P6XL43_9CHLR|nr:hypothetical protein [Herpetosiphon geysericola]KPL80616.1 hypothetical protein SE18_23660 [Herpetosiphon geysericola]